MNARTESTSSFPLSPSLIVTLVILGAILLGGFGLYGYANSVRNEGVTREAELTAQYLVNQNDLSSYISGFYESVGVANLKSEKMDQIISDAVKGRYALPNTSAQPGQATLFSAINEAYPSLDGLGVYDRMMDYISGGRNRYKNTQDKLLDMLRGYDTWRNLGFVRSFFLSGFPSERLTARIGTKAFHGKEAEDQMYLIVTTEQGNAAYTSGTLAPLTVPRN